MCVCVCVKIALIGPAQSEMINYYFGNSGFEDDILPTDKKRKLTASILTVDDTTEHLNFYPLKSFPKSSFNFKLSALVPSLFIFTFLLPFLVRSFSTDFEERHNGNDTRWLSLGRRMSGCGGEKF